MVVSGLFAPQPAAAYSVLAHEANIDALWDSYAYRGCVIQDLGYYPFGRLVVGPQEQCGPRKGDDMKSSTKDQV
jgi:hypothetical protein